MHRMMIAEAERDSFEWFHNWYPMTPVDYLDPSKPHPITLLGKNLVLWKDESGQWSCLEDICSHRSGLPWSHMFSGARFIIEDSFSRVHLT